MEDLIRRQDAINLMEEWSGGFDYIETSTESAIKEIQQLPSAQPERLTDDDFETIRIHLNAFKEKLCNQHRWKEAEEYQRIIDRFMAFAQSKTAERMSETEQKIDGRGGR